MSAWVQWQRRPAVHERIYDVLKADVKKGSRREKDKGKWKGYRKRETVSKVQLDPDWSLELDHVCWEIWHNSADGFDPLKTVLRSTQSCDCCGASEWNGTSLTYDACACAGGVTWLVLLLKQSGIVCCRVVSHTVILSSLGMPNCCAGGRPWRRNIKG